MFVGHSGVGKTTLAAGLLGMDSTDKGSTDGIEVHIGRCYINKSTGDWHPTRETEGRYYARIYLIWK